MINILRHELEIKLAHTYSCIISALNATNKAAINALIALDAPNQTIEEFKASTSDISNKLVNDLNLIKPFYKSDYINTGFKSKPFYTNIVKPPTTNIQTTEAK